MKRNQTKSRLSAVCEENLQSQGPTIMPQKETTTRSIEFAGGLEDAVFQLRDV